MEIGWAIDKGFEVAKLSFKVYQAFKDEDTNAPQQFRNLSKELSAFNTVFEQLLDVLKKHKKPLIVPLSSIQFTLEKCSLLQEKYAVLSEVHTGRTFKQAVVHASRVLQWSFLAEKHINDLRSELASHTRILSLYTDTLNLKNNLEAREENHEIREQFLEMLPLLKAQQQRSDTTELASLHLPDVPQHQPLGSADLAQLDLPEAPQHEPISLSRSWNRLAELDTARSELETSISASDDLEALQFYLERGSRILEHELVPADDSDSSSSHARFIDLARHEMGIHQQRVENWQKRVQHLPSRSSTVGSNRSVSTVRTNPASQIEPAGQLAAQSPRSTISRRSSAVTNGIPQINTIAANTGPATGLQISLPIEYASLGSPSSARRNSTRRRTVTLTTDASKIFERYLASFEAELEELDLDGQIAKTREDLFNLVQTSFPPSPDIRLSPTASSASNQLSPSIDGMMSSSPPTISTLASPSRRDTSFSTNTRRTSVDASSWKYFAKDVHIDDVQEYCKRCTTVSNTVLQFAQRPSGGLSFRLLCIGSAHRPTDGLLFRHDLSSSVPVYPHVYHTGKFKGFENNVRVLGQPSKLEAWVLGRRVALQVQPSAGPCYKFSCPEDSECFQQLIQGERLVQRFDVKTVATNAYNGQPIRNIAVRVWKSFSTSIASIMLYATLVDRCEAFGYTEQKLSFEPPTGSGSKVKLKLKDTIKPISKRHKRANSRDSGVSGISTGSDDLANPSAVAKIRWIEIEFQDRTERDTFLEIWNN